MTPSVPAPIFTLTGKVDPRLPTLDEVKTRVKDDLIAERATALALKRANELSAKLKSAKDFAAAAKAESLIAKDTELLARGAAIPEVGVVPDVEKAVFTLPAGSVTETFTRLIGENMEATLGQKVLTEARVGLAVERFNMDGTPRRATDEAQPPPAPLAAMQTLFEPLASVNGLSNVASIQLAASA